MDVYTTGPCILYIRNGKIMKQHNRRCPSSPPHHSHTPLDPYSPTPPKIQESTLIKKSSTPYSPLPLYQYLLTAQLTPQPSQHSLQPPLHSLQPSILTPQSATPHSLTPFFSQTPPHNPTHSSTLNPQS